MEKPWIVSEKLINLQNEILLWCNELNKYASTEEEFINCISQMGNIITEFRECMWLRWDYSWFKYVKKWRRKDNNKKLIKCENEFIAVIGLYNELQSYGVKLLNKTITSAEEIAYKNILNHFKETFAELIHDLLFFNNIYSFSSAVSDVVSQANYEVHMAHYSSAYLSGVKEETNKYMCLSNRIENLLTKFRNIVDKYNSLDISMADALKSQLETRLSDMCAELNSEYHLLFDKCNVVKTYTEAESINLWFQSISGSEAVNDKFNSALQKMDLEHWNGANAVFDEILKEEPSNPGAYLGKFMVFYKVKTPKDICTVFKENAENSTNLITAYELGNDVQKEFIHSAMSLRQKEITYSEYLNIMQEAKTAEKYMVCKKFFEMLGDYKDSKQLSIDCENNVISLTTTKINWKPEIIVYESIQHIPSANYKGIFRKPGLFEK